MNNAGMANSIFRMGSLLVGAGIGLANLPDSAAGCTGPALRDPANPVVILDRRPT
jgi:hypothetical protein